MKPGKILLILLLIFLGLIALLLLLTSIAAGPETAFRMYYYNFTDIDDYKMFPSRTLYASRAPYRFGENISGAPARYQGIPLDQFLEEHGVAAFLVIKDGTIRYEKYFGAYNETTPIQAFSMSKSLLSILIGRAVDDGYFAVNQPVTDFVPELAANGFDRVTIEDLLQMASGSNYRQTGLDELSPFSLHPRFEYSTRLEQEILKLKVIDEPGSKFIYKSGDNALLGLVLRRALRTKSITEYMQEALWTPLGMEHEGLYVIDHSGADGLEKTWCCLAATARDFAKFGQLMLNEGVWNGKQIVSRDWVEKSTLVDPTDNRIMDPTLPQMGLQSYQYQWWLDLEDDAYLAAGHLGQYLYVNPAERVVIVRLGREGDETKFWLDLFHDLAHNIE